MIFKKEVEKILNEDISNIDKVDTILAFTKELKSKYPKSKDEINNLRNEVVNRLEDIPPQADTKEEQRKPQQTQINRSRGYGRSR